MHDYIRAIIKFQQLQQDRKVRFSDVEENTKVLLLFIDLPDHKFQEICIIGDIFFFLEVVSRRNESLLIDLQKEINKIFISLERLHQELKKREDCFEEL